VIVKGFHLAHVYWEEPAARPIADVDVVVPGVRVPAVEAALLGAHFVPTQPPPDVTRHPYKRHWRAAHVDPRHWSIDGVHARAPWELDVHVSHDREFRGGLSRLDHLAGHVAPLELEGRRVLAPVHPLLLPLLAQQLSESLSGMRLPRLLDIISVVRRDRTDGMLRSDALLTALAPPTRARYCYPAFALANALVPDTIDAVVIAACHRDSTPLARSLVPRLSPAGAPPGVTSIPMQLMWADGPIQLTRLAARLVAGHVARGPGHLVRSLWRLIRPGASGSLRLRPPRESRG
jgi:hypothetical protein